MGQYKIKSTPMFSLKEILGNVEDITRWTLNGLPKENVSFENMIIIDETKRSKYPLMIDPEGQAFAYFEKNLVRKHDDLSGLPDCKVVQMS